MKIVGLERVVAALRDRAAKAAKDENVSVAVGYATAYALKIHETPPGTPNPPKSDAQRKAMFASIHEEEKRGHVPWSVGSWKYLEGPAREFSKEIGGVILTAMRQGKSMAQSLVLGGLRLQRESQKRVPVSHAILKASAFTTLETQ